MNTATFLNNVLPALSNQGMRSPSHSPSFLSTDSGKNSTIQQNEQIISQAPLSDNHRTISATQPKDRPAHNSDFKNVLNRQIKSRESDNEPVSQKTDAKKSKQNSDPSPDSSQPVESPVISDDASITASVILDTAITTPATDTPLQVADITSQTNIAAPLTLNTQCLMPDSSSNIENQEAIIFIQQSSQPDSSQQTTKIQNTAQLIAVPDKPNISEQQKTENVVSPESPAARNPSTNNLIPNTNLNFKSAEINPTEGQTTQADSSTSSLSGRLTVTGSAISNNQTVNTSAESPPLQTINITNTHQTDEPDQVNNQEQYRLNQQPSGSSVNQQSTILPAEANAKAGSNQKLIQSSVSQEKATDLSNKPDTLKTDLQNANLTSQIARGLTSPESGANVTAADQPKLPADAIRNIALADIDTTQAIREQISQSVAAAAQHLNRQITIQLNPPELGSVSVKFSQAGSELTGLIEASNSRTFSEIHQQIPEILHSLEQAGVTVKRIDVTLSDLPGRSNHDSSRDNSSQFNWDRPGFNNHHDSPQQNFSSDSFTTSSHYSSTSSQYEPRAASHESRVTSSALDIMI